MRLIVYLLIIKGVLFAAAMLMPNEEPDRTFGALERPVAVPAPSSGASVAASAAT